MNLNYTSRDREGKVEETTEILQKAKIGSILIIDDNIADSTLLLLSLEQEGYKVTILDEANQALNLLKTEIFDLIVLDVKASKINGYQVLEYMRTNEFLSNIPVFVTSSSSEVKEVVECIEMGAEYYLPKSFNPTIQKALINTFLEKKRACQQAQTYARLLKREMEIGRQIQTNFLPDELPQLPGWELAACFHPARDVSGDFYDVFILPEGQVGFVIADVCDKGVGAALFMAVFRSLLRAFSCNTTKLQQGASPITNHNESAQPPANLLAVINALNAVGLTNGYITNNHVMSNMFATLFFGVLDPITGKMNYVNAGHEAPVILSSEGRVKAKLKPTGPAVGVFQCANFESQQVNLEPEESLVAYTDGVTEARNLIGEFFTEGKLLLSLSEQSPTSASTLLKQVETKVGDHIGGAHQFDDITMLVIFREPVSEK